MVSLSQAATNAPSTSQPHYLAGAATPDCSGAGAGTALMNPAFVLVAPVADRDGQAGDHPGFDGVHASFGSAGGRCVAPPGHPADALFDDLVVAEGHAALLGWVMAHTR